MRGRILATGCGLAALGACASARVDRVRGAADRLVARESGASYALAYHDLGRGTEVLLHADVPLHAASTMKIPIMIEVYRQAERGKLGLDDALRVRNEFTSIADGSRYALDPADDSEHGLYRRVGQDLAVRELVRAMIVRSSNLATNLLLEHVGVAAVQRTVDDLGAHGMRVLRGVEDGAAFRAGRNNTTTARALACLLAAIERAQAASAASCREMLDILAAQELDHLIGAGLPAGTRVAHKTGQITGIQHDAALVYPERAPPYVLVVLTRGFADEDASARFIAAVAAEVHRLHVGS